MLSLIKSQRPDRTPEEWVWLELTERIRKRWVKQEDGSETYELQILVCHVRIMLLLGSVS